MASYYVASCLFSARFPKASMEILEYIRSRPEIRPIRCCIPRFRVEPNTLRIQEGCAREAWTSMEPWEEFKPGDIIYSVCHNCTNISEEMVPGVQGLSLWELIDADPDFQFPDYSGLTVTVQDCWRTREKSAEQAAVRSVLAKCGIRFLEARDHHGETEFCGSTLYRPQPKKNAFYAPKHYVEQAAGKFLPHSEEEQIAIMREYCSQFTTPMVVCYCHYCLEGLLQGGVDARHLAHLIFAPDEDAHGVAVPQLKG